MTPPPQAPPKRFQWRLSSLFLLMTAVALGIGVIVNVQTRESLRADFQSLPENDDAFRAWFERDFGATVDSITRETASIEVHYRRSFLWTSLPVPPWEKLGYVGFRSFRISVGPDYVRYSFIALIIAGIYFALRVDSWLWDRSAIKPRPPPGDAAHD